MASAAPDVETVSVPSPSSGALVRVHVRPQLDAYANALTAAYAARERGAVLLVGGWWFEGIDGLLSGGSGEREALPKPIARCLSRRWAG
jgi:hypothetical protein